MIQDASKRLLDAQIELNDRSLKLERVEIELEPVEDDYNDFIEGFEADLWERAATEEDVKFPPERVRLALAHRAIDDNLYARYRALKRVRGRHKQRISDLKEIVASQRSIVSAAKLEQEASEGPQPAWSGS